MLYIYYSKLTVMTHKKILFTTLALFGCLFAFSQRKSPEKIDTAFAEIKKDNIIILKDTTSFKEYLSRNLSEAVIKSCRFSHVLPLDFRNVVIVKQVSKDFKHEFFYVKAKTMGDIQVARHLKRVDNKLYLIDDIFDSLYREFAICCGSYDCELRIDSQQGKLSWIGFSLKNSGNLCLVDIVALGSKF